MSVDAYLNFNGNCREAVEFYADVFGTDKPQIMTFGDTPPHPDFTLPEEAKHLVMHARLTILGSNVMFSDVFPGMPLQSATISAWPSSARTRMICRRFSTSSRSAARS